MPSEHSERLDRYCRQAQRQAIDSLQSAVAVDDRHYDRALANQGAVLKSAAEMMLLLAELRGTPLGPTTHERLTALADSDPGA